MPYLAFNLNNGNEFIFDLVEDRLALGRDAQNEILIENEGISSFHAELLKQKDGAYEVVDLKSSNGTFVNDERVGRALLKPGDKVRFGPLEASFRASPIVATGEAPSREADHPLNAAASPAPGPDETTSSEAAPPTTKAEEPSSEPARQSVPPPHLPPSPHLPKAPIPIAGAGRPVPKPSPPGVPPRPSAPARPSASPLVNKPTAPTRPSPPPMGRPGSPLPGIRKPGSPLQPSPPMRPVVAPPGKPVPTPATERVPTPVTATPPSASPPTGLSSAPDSPVVPDPSPSSATPPPVPIPAASKTTEPIVLAIVPSSDETKSVTGTTRTDADQTAAAKATTPVPAAPIATPKPPSSERNASMTDASTEANRPDASSPSDKQPSGEHAALEKELAQKQQALLEAGALEKFLKQGIELLHADIESARKRQVQERREAEEIVAGLSRRKDELEKSVATLLEDERRLDEKLSTLRDKEAGLDQQLAELEEKERRLEEIGKLIEEVTAKHTAQEAALSEISARREFQESSLRALQEKGAAQNSLVQTLVRQQASLEENIELLQMSQEEARKKVDELEAATREQKQNFQDRQAEHEKLSQEQEQKRQATEALLKDLQAKASQLEIFVADHKGVETKLAEAKAQLEAASKGNEEASARASQLQEELSARQQELERISSELQEKSKALEETVTRHDGLQTSLGRMAEEETAQGKRLESLHLETESADLILSTRRTEIGDIEASLSHQRKQLELVEVQLAELAGTGEKLTAAKDELEAALKATAAEQETLDRLKAGQVETEAAIAKLKADSESDRTQMEATRAELEAATRELQRSRTERAQLEAKAVDVRGEIQMLTTSLAVKKSEIGSSERTLESLYGRIAAANERLAELEKIDGRLQHALASLKQAETQRNAEEKRLVDLEVQRETLRREVINLTEQEKLVKSRLEAQNRQLENQETQTLELQKKAESLTTDIATREVELVQLERKIQATRDEEKAIRAGMPELNAEMGAAQSALQSLLSQRGEAESHALNLAKEVTTARRKLEELEQVIAARLDDKSRCEREIEGLSEALAQQEQSIQKVLDDGTAAGKRLGELQASIQEHERLLVASSEKHDQFIKQLREEEAGLAAGIENLRKLHASHEIETQASQSRLVDLESRIRALCQTGDHLQSLQEITSQAEARRRDAEARLSQFSELELSLQVRINGLQETVKRENQRLEQLRQERESLETEVQKNLDKASRDAEEVKRQLSDEIKGEEARLVARMHERNSALLEKQEQLKDALAASTEEQTIIFFAGDIIKRLDLIDSLIQRCSREGGDSGMAQQLRTLRASFEDVLAQHGVSEFRLPPGTEIDVALRQRIKVVENIGGNGRSKVIESYQPGYIYNPGDGREIVLRKVEVKTSSDAQNHSSLTTPSF